MQKSPTYGPQPTTGPWPPGHVSSWAVHAGVVLTSPCATFSTIVVRAVTPVLVSCGWWCCYKPCVGGGSTTSGRQTTVQASRWLWHHCGPWGKSHKGGGAILTPVVAPQRAWRQYHKPHTGTGFADSLMHMLAAPVAWCACLWSICARAHT